MTGAEDLWLRYLPGLLATVGGTATIVLARAANSQAAEEGSLIGEAIPRREKL